MTTRISREDLVASVRGRAKPCDVLVIGGGATGVGIAMDAASRGLDVVLLEQSDFGKGTSSRSTKLVHGGVRYLRQGNLTLVRDALRERSLLRQNAPHLVHDMPFLIPCHNLWERFFYGVGLKLYDLLAWGNDFGASRRVSKSAALKSIGVLNPKIVEGGVIYHDGQFDDSRLLINMVQTAVRAGGCLLNYLTVSTILHDAAGAITGVKAIDNESGEEFKIQSRCVINAAGPFCDAIRRMDDDSCEPMLSASQGIHLVLPREFFPGDVAMMVPKTSDGRVIFIIPWHGHAIVGTTDTPISNVSLEPSPKEEEIQFLLDTMAEYLQKPPKRGDILSVFTGIRPLVKGDKSARTASLSRDHVIRVSKSNLLTITGGKWTTVRKMAEDCVDQAIKLTGIDAQPCMTKTLRLSGAVAAEQKPGTSSEESISPRSYYGADLQLIEQLESETPELARSLHPSLSIRASDVIWSVRYELARTVEDVLARRTRGLFLNANAANEIAETVARLMATEMHHDENWIQSQLVNFRDVARHYLP